MEKLKYGRVYYFKYDAKLKDVLPVWDKRPLVIPLFIGSTHTLGLNIHWIPANFRKQFVEWLLKESEKSGKKGTKEAKKIARVTYNVIKNNSALKDAIKGIRLYINTRITMPLELDKTDIADFTNPMKVKRGFFTSYQPRKAINHKRFY